MQFDYALFDLNFKCRIAKKTKSKADHQTQNLF
jgi:hypothetical protein